MTLGSHLLQPALLLLLNLVFTLCQVELGFVPPKIMHLIIIIETIIIDNNPLMNRTKLNKTVTTWLVCAIFRTAIYVLKINFHPTTPLGHQSLY